MRDIPDELAVRLASGATTLAYLWRVERRDGAVFGFTDHDRDLTAGGVAYKAQSGFLAGALEKGLGLAIDTASAEGALNDERITAEDLARGLWDGARVDVWRADWTQAELRVHLFAGRLGETRRGELAFAAELRGLQAPLNAPVGRVFSRFCDADIGDARCSVTLSDPRWRGTGTVVSVIDGAVFTASGLESFEDGLFSRGRIAWSAGGGSEVAVHNAGAPATITLADPWGSPLTLGTTFTITAGCDKRLTTCRNRFANTINFRGFPHMPGNDAVQSGPVAGEAMDGSSRWTP